VTGNKNRVPWVSVTTPESYQCKYPGRIPAKGCNRLSTQSIGSKKQTGQSFRRKPLLGCGLLKAQRAIQFHSVCGWFQRVGASLAVIIVSCWVLAGCVVYEPPPAPPPSPFDRAWNAALGATQDEGVRVTSADRGSGVIRGSRDQQEVTINLQTQADGSVRIEMSARGPKGADPGLADRISRAYDRRMGR
jgi:hypothetical protein